MRELETEHAVANERERIYQDLHDDVGAKLLSLVYRAASADDANLARSALQDLREVVSRTGSDSYSVEALMADWRAECGQRLREAGIELDWRLSAPLAETHLTQPQALNIGRILREAVSNIIRHARASHVVLDLEVAGGRLHLSVRDDGIGCDEEPLHLGRGLLSMETRAQAGRCIEPPQRRLRRLRDRARHPPRRHPDHRPPGTGKSTLRPIGAVLR
jgi:signal transduction histidine kinase